MVTSKNSQECTKSEHIDTSGSKRVTVVNDSGTVLNPATQENQTNGSQKTQITDTAGNLADIISCDGHKGLVTFSPGHVSLVNSTNTPLLVGGVFTGEAEDIKNFGVIQVMVTASHTSATDGFKIEFSVDGITWDDGDVYTINAGDAKVYSFQPAARYYRIVYTNGGTAQTYFRLQTILKPYYVKPSSHRINDLISPQDDAELVKAVLTAQKPDGYFTPIDSTAGGNLKVSIEETNGTSNMASETTLSSIDGKITVCDTTGKATAAKQDTLITNTNALTTMVTTAVTLTTLNIAYLIPTIEQVGRRTIIIYNVSDTDVFYGASNVTTTTGILIP
ncbi:MAG: hypothetical protein K0A90_00005, partial [Methanosarcinaceae archaeon]|nr:hypothetical protein [Methanosarcinaceae archaeon]